MPKRQTNSLLLALALGIASLFLTAEPARALTISPVIAEISANPGQTIDHEFKAINDSRESKLFYLDFQSFEARDETGRPTLLKTRTGFPTWMRGPESITLGPGEARTVTIHISVPAGADPGGHFAAILLRNDPPRLVDEGSVGITSQVGTMVLLRVSGSAAERGDILEFDTKNNNHWLKSLPTDFYYRFQNEGEDWAKPLGDIVIENIWGGTAKIIPANPAGANILPRSIRRFEASWITRQGETENSKTERPPELPSGFWNKVRHEARYAPFGRYTARLTLTYGTGQQHSSAETHFWIVPWELLAVAVPSGVAALVILRLLVRRYNRLVITRDQRKKQKIK